MIQYLRYILSIYIGLNGFIVMSQSQMDSLSIGRYLDDYNTTQDTNYLRKALDLSLKGSRTETTADLLILFAKWWMMENNNQLALNYLLEAKKITGRTNDLSIQERIYANLAQIYYLNMDHKRAILNGEEALNLARRQHNKFNESIHLGNLGAYYLMAKEMDKSLASHTACLNIGLELEDSITILVSLNNIGTLHFSNSSYFQANQYYDQALGYALSLNDSLEICRILTNLAETNLMLNKGSKAVSYINQSELFCQEISLHLASFNALVKAKAYKSIGKYQAAAEYFEKQIMLADSAMNQDKVKEINELTAQYEEEIREQKILRLEAEQALQQVKLSRMIGISIAAGLILLMLGIIAWQIQRQRKKSDQLLQNILPLTAIDELKRHGRVKARRHDHVSILFTDFVGFTSMANQLPPEQLVDQIDQCYRQFDHIMEHHQCEKIKTIGDAYMAVCGLPQSNKDHALNLAKAAIDIRNYIRQYNNQNRQNGVPELPIRIGIHSGTVVAGVVGSHKFVYDIWGDAVNIAARMEQNSLPDHINISAHTMQLLGNLANTIYRGELEVKGKGSFPMYFLEDIKI
jgi:adenylate cyclase